MSNRGETIRDRIDSKYEKTAGYLIYDVTEAIGQEMDEVDTVISETNAKLDIDNLTGNELTKFVSQRRGITRKAATYAVGTVTVTGTGTVAVGDIFETANGVQFEATSEVEVTETGTVPIQAKVAGTSGNVGATSINQMPVTIAGISECINEEATAEGYDEEDDESLRERYYTALRTPAASGNKVAYNTWALEVAGVGDVQTYPLGHGNGTVDVVIIDTEMQPASEALVKEVQDYIDPNSEGKGLGTAPIGAKCYVEAATVTDINVSAKITLQSQAKQSDVETAIKQAITDYLAEIAFTGSAVSYILLAARITDAKGVADVENLTLNDGTSNISIPDRHVAVTGTVTLTYA